MGWQILWFAGFKCPHCHTLPMLRSLPHLFSQHTALHCLGTSACAFLLLISFLPPRKRDLAAPRLACTALACRMARFVAISVPELFQLGSATVQLMMLRDAHGGAS